jgi:hypothetical protein
MDMGIERKLLSAPSKQLGWKRLTNNGRLWIWGWGYVLPHKSPVQPVAQSLPVQPPADAKFGVRVVGGRAHYHIVLAKMIVGIKRKRLFAPSKQLG